MNKRYYIIVLMALVLLFPDSGLAEEKEESKKEFEVPSHVLNISKENTYPNSTEDQEVVEPSELTEELIEGVEVPIENPDLIKMLNETSIKPSPIAFGYRGMVYVGRWPLNYQSDETNINWEYQTINTNELNNIGGDSEQKMQYNQQEKREVKGALTNKISNPDDVKKMMLLKAKDKIELPLAYTTVIGQNTKKENSYSVPAKKYGELQAYAPAVNERGQVTFGEVYFQLKGYDKSIVIKNVTKQGIGAWIPVQDHVSFSFQLK
ncbi:YfkD-like protein [Lentibacillus halodurans]|uniref:YfkD-like protein n=1 Tax=Lentibacillus halodurans TaxID=237679 RepID=A0A1I0YVY7_9BACI|nr:YfkD famly protein [Lentibacillus halodurans]SFB16550.1 YfkD-like protein [Lentibacillus halodurans]